MSGNQLIQTPDTKIAGPVVTIVMDGVGLGQEDASDAVFNAHTPHLDQLRQGPLSTELTAHGTAVGMPGDGDMGNSEVGHNTLGAGRVFDQGAKLVKQAMESGVVFQGDTWRHLAQSCVRRRTPLHLLGLLSDGNVHSHIKHVLAILNRADAENIEEVYLHVLLDGRDVPRTSALHYVEELESLLVQINQKKNRRYAIASGGGRMTTTMDRYEANWSVVERGWRAHVLGEARSFDSARTAVLTMRGENPGICDQDLDAFVITENGQPLGPIEDGAAVIAFNFRGDRMLQISAAFEDANFTDFPRVRHPDVEFAGITLYDGDAARPRQYLVSPPEITHTFSELLCDVGVRQFACSETQKFGHVTYFWNGNRTGYFDKTLERYIEVPSLVVPFNEAPEMSAAGITQTLLEQLQRDRFDFSRINLANGDMVGHTGDFAATLKAVECVDRCVGEIVHFVLSRRGAVIVTADHGNADDMAERDKATGTLQLDPAGQLVPKTSHSLNPVPFCVAMHPDDASRYSLSLPPAPGLGHIAATTALLLGYRCPESYLPGLLTFHPGGISVK